MAKFGIDATNMGKPNTPTYISPGIDLGKQQAEAISRKGAADVSLIKLAGDTAIDAYKGYQLADLEKEQEANIAAYGQSKVDKQTAISEAETGVAANVSQLDAMWGKGDAAPALGIDAVDISDTEKSHQVSLLKLKSAYDQGVMSPSELNQRVLATTRTALTRNPGLKAELLTHSQQVLELSGIQQVVNYDQQVAETEAKRVQDIQKRVLDLADANDIPYQFDSRGQVTNFFQVKQAVDAIQVEKQAANALKRGNVAKDEESKAGALSFARQFAGPAINGLISEANTEALVAFNGAGTDAQKLAYARNLYANVRATVMNKVGYLASEPVIKPHLEYMEKQLSVLEKNLESAKTGEDAAKIIKNQAGIMRDEGYMSFTKAAGITPDNARALSGFLTGDAWLKLKQHNPETANKITQTVSNMIVGAAGAIGTDHTATLSPGKYATPEFIKQQAVAAGKGDLASQEVLDNTIKALGADLSNPKQFDNTPEGTAKKFKFYDDYIRQVGDVTAKDGMAKLSDGSRTQVAGHLAEYMDLTLKDMDKQIKSAESKGVKVVWKHLPDGRLSVETSDPRFTQTLVQNYVSRVNSGLGAYANLQGVDKKQAATTFYPDYSKYFTGTGRVSNQEISGVITPSNNRRSTDTKRPTKGGNPILDRDGLTANETFPTQGAAESNAKELATAIKSKRIGTKERAILEDEWEKLTGEKWK